MVSFTKDTHTTTYLGTETFTDFGFSVKGKPVTILKNYTKHPIYVVDKLGNMLLDIEPENPREQAQVLIEHIHVNPIIIDSVTTGIRGLPDPEPGVALVVSIIVKKEFPERNDLLSPSGFLKNAHGKIIGCRYLMR